MPSFTKLTALVSLAVVGGQAAAVSRRQSGGCGTSHDFAGQTRPFDMTSSGVARDFNVHLPANYDPNDSRAVIFSYHGHGMTAEDMESLTRLSTDINQNMLVVYPQGLDNAWQGPSYAVDGVNDMQFTTDMVTFMQNNFCIDPDRIFAQGYSNGGGFIGGLACNSSHGGAFAAFASVNGAYYMDVDEGDCQPQHLPTPYWSCHGTGDTTVPYEGGQGSGGPLPAIPDWLDRWQERNGCTGSSDPVSNDDLVRTEWNCNGDAQFQVHNKMIGHEHNYPTADDVIDASQLIVNWFSDHSR